MYLGIKAIVSYLLPLCLLSLQISDQQQQHQSATFSKLHFIDYAHYNDQFRPFQLHYFITQEVVLLVTEELVKSEESLHKSLCNATQHISDRMKKKEVLLPAEV